MSELRECPFCGSYEEKPINHAEDCFIRMYAENVDEYYYSETLIHDRESMKAAWNTRTERTCRPLRKSGKEFDSEERLSSLVALCSECLGYLGEAQDVFLGSVAFCSSCGARVVVE